MVVLILKEIIIKAGLSLEMIVMGRGWVVMQMERGRREEGREEGEEEREGAETGLRKARWLFSHRKKL
jgi:hypothetical protein